MKKVNFLKQLFVSVLFFLMGTLFVKATDRNVGGGISPYPNIQAAIDAAVTGDVVKVYPGNYIEIASGRTIVTASGSQGPYQFGLFFDASKPGISVIGVDAVGNPITSYSAVAANIQLNATNGFGPSGVFVNADDITITGLNLYLDPSGGQNKTVEVIGENFTIKYCRLTDGNSLYLNDWSYNTVTNTSHITKYFIDGNKFENGTSIDIASGAGFSGPVSGRKILNNYLDAAGGYWAMISFNGSGTGVPWFVESVGGAVITGNTLVNGEQYIRHRGVVDNSQFDWLQYWSANTFDRSVISLSNDISFIPRIYSYVSGSYTFTNVIRIGAIIKADINNVAQTGDVVRVGAGTYTENVIVSKELEIKGAGQANTFVIPEISNPDCGGAGGGSLCAGSSNVFLIQANNVKIHDLTVDGDNPSLTSGIVVGGADLDARNGIITNHPLGVYQNLEVYNVTVKNIFLRGIYASSGGTFNFYNNTITNVQANYASIGMFNFGGSGNMSNNIVSDCNDAISSNHSMGTTYSGNTITNSGSGIHTDNNGDAAGSIADIIENNSVSNSPVNGYGIFVFSAYKDVIVQNNTITNVEVGLTCAGSYTTAIPVFRKNTVNGLMKSNSIGVYSTTEIWGYTSGNQNAKFLNNFIRNNVKGFLIASELGYTNTTTANENSITGNTIGVKLVNDYTEAPPTGTFGLNMNCNWWGTWTGPFNATSNPGGTGSSVPVNANFTPWLTSGVDINPAMPGFQPIANSCQGTATMLADNKCGKKNEKKVNICHNGSTICIATDGLQSHFDHGDLIGVCNGPNLAEESGLKGITKAENSVILLTKDYKLSNIPNPFSSATRILLELPEDSKLSIKVYDITGREVATLVNGSWKAGVHDIEFNASQLGAGVYMLMMKATAGGQLIIKSIKLVKQ